MQKKKVTLLTKFWSRITCNTLACSYRYRQTHVYRSASPMVKAKPKNSPSSPLASLASQLCALHTLRSFGILLLRVEKSRWRMTFSIHCILYRHWVPFWGIKTIRALFSKGSHFEWWSFKKWLDRGSTDEWNASGVKKKGEAKTLEKKKKDQRLRMPRGTQRCRGEGKKSVHSLSDQNLRLPWMRWMPLRVSCTCLGISIRPFISRVTLPFWG